MAQSPTPFLIIKAVHWCNGVPSTEGPEALHGPETSSYPLGKHKSILWVYMIHIYIYMHMYTHMCTHTYMYTYTIVPRLYTYFHFSFSCNMLFSFAMLYIYVYMYIYLYVCMYVCMCVCMYVCMYVCSMYVCMYVCRNIENVNTIYVYIYKQDIHTHTLPCMALVRDQL